MTEKERFLSHVHMVPESGCWIWMGALIKRSGYGVFGSKEKTVSAHRFSYRMFVGEIPSGMLVRHSCDTPCCVNPYHLSTGTHKDNAQDKMSRGRGAVGKKHGMFGRALKGSVNGHAKLTEEDVQHIRKSDLSQSELGRQYGVTQAAIWNILNRKTWAHI